MFFDDPARLRQRPRPRRAGGGLAFACWRGVEANPWFVGVAIAPLLAPAPEPGRSPTGPLSRADPDATRSLLEAAGWSRVRCGAPDAAAVERDVLVDDEYLG